MNICLANWFYRPFSGAVESLLESLAKSLVERGHKVWVVTSHYTKSKMKEKRDGVQIIRRPEFNPLDKSDPQKKGYNLQQFLTDFLAKKQIDILDAHNLHLRYYPAHTFAVNMAAMATEVPLVLTMHNFCENELERVLLKHMMWKGIICTTKHMTEHAYSIGVKPDMLYTVWLGIDENQFKPGYDPEWLRQQYGIKKDDLLLHCPSRLINSLTGAPVIEEKGLTSLINAMSFLCEIFPNLKLLITSPRPAPKLMRHFKRARRKLEELAIVYGVHDKVIFATRYDYADMPKVYAGADIVVLPSVYEPFGMVYIEAMACAKPVVGCSAGGVPEIISHGMNGYLCKPRDPVDLAKVLTWLLKDAEKRRRFGEAGRRIVEEKFTHNRRVDETIAVYEKIAKG